MSDLDLTAFKAEVKSLICSRLCKERDYSMLGRSADR